MKRTPRTLKLVLGVISIASFIVPATGQITTSSRFASQEMQKKAAETVTINGKVSAVTETSLTLVDDQKAEQVVAIDGKTKISKAGKAVTAADIKPDDMVVVLASKGEGNALTAITIKVA